MIKVGRQDLKYKQIICKKLDHFPISPHNKSNTLGYGEE